MTTHGYMTRFIMKSISSAAIILFKKFISIFLIRYVTKFYVRHDITVLLVVVSIKYPFQYVKFDFYLFLLPVSMLKKDQSHYFSQILEIEIENPYRFNFMARKLAGMELLDQRRKKDKLVILEDLGLIC